MVLCTLLEKARIHALMALGNQCPNCSMADDTNFSYEGRENRGFLWV